MSSLLEFSSDFFLNQTSLFYTTAAAGGAYYFILKEKAKQSYVAKVSRLRVGITLLLLRILRCCLLALLYIMSSILL